MARKQQQKTARPARWSHVEQMYNWGPRGLWDFSEQNARVVKPSRRMLQTSPIWRVPQLKILPEKYDVAGQDHPRTDVQSYPLASGKAVRAGGDDPPALDRFGKKVVPLVDASLSKPEQDALNVYYEYPDANLRNRKVGGLTDYWHSRAGIPYSHVMVNKGSMNSEYLLLHETLHVSRHSPTFNRDIDREEAKTDLETIARLPYAAFLRMKETHTGYYRFLPGDPWKNAVHDRILLTGSIEKNLTGPAARRRVDQVFARTRLSRLRITDRPTAPPLRGLGRARGSRSSPRLSPEGADRYFEIVLADGTRVNVHLSVSEPLTKREIRDLLRRQYRNAVAVNEYRDGIRGPL